MVYTCYCPICNGTDDGYQEDEQEYIEYHYKQYCKETENPLSMDEWLKSL